MSQASFSQSFFLFYKKRSLVLLAALAVIFLLTPLIFMPSARAATGNANVTTQPTETEFKPTVGHKVDTSFAVVKFGLKDADADDTLQKVTFTLNDSGSSGIVASDLSAASVYKDADGNNTFSAALDTKLGSDQTTVNVGSTTTVFTATTTLTNAATTYFLVLKFAVGVADGKKFTVNVANNGLTISGSATTTTALTGTTVHISDGTGPTINSSATYPANNSTNIPLGASIHVDFTDANEIDPVTLNTVNIKFTKDPSGTNTAVPFTLKKFPKGFDLSASAAPTFSSGTSWTKPWSPTNCFADVKHNTAIVFDCNTTFAAGDMVMFQTGNFAPEFGVVTNATLTGGTFAINGFSIYGPQNTAHKD